MGADVSPPQEGCLMDLVPALPEAVPDDVPTSLS